MFCSRCGTEVQVSSRFCPTCGLDLTTITQGMTASQPATPAGQQPQPDEADIVRDALKDEYDLEKELGRGGMAIVYKARDKALEREVAIKVLPFSLSFDAEFVERFQREARTAAKLEHPNIIPIYRVGKSGRVIYFVMKFVRGKSLSSVIEARGALPVPELRRVMIECARALGFAHRHGIVHRDIKPDNIMFDELGQAIVMDFGIAKAQSGARLTGTGMSIGTPHYMSPEQARAQNLDGKSDIYSLGVVAYQCLCGHVPFDGEDSFSIGYKHIMEELPLPPLENADQRELFAVIQKMMAKKQEDRYQTADEAVLALEMMGGSQGRGSMADMATMPTLAIEPMKKPAASATDKTTPLPRASGSMARPAEAAAAAAPSAGKAAPAKPVPAAPGAPPAAGPPAPAKPKPSFRPTPKPRSNAPYVALGVIAVVAAALGGYMILGRGTGTQVALQTPPDTAPRATPVDTAKAQAPADTGAHPAVTTPPATDTTRHAAPQTTPARTATATAPRTTATPPRTTTTAAGTPTTRPAATPGTTTAGGTGYLVITGNLPAGRTITVDGQVGQERRILAPGRHELRVEAAGYRPYDAVVTIVSGQTRTQPVTMVPLSAAAAPAPGSPTGGGSGAPPVDAARCQTDPAFGVRNLNLVCYQVRPRPRTVPLVVPPASCPPTLRAAANVLVKVSTSGDVENASLQRGTACAAFNDAALAFARDLAYMPATKGGTPVVAWIIQPISPAPRAATPPQ